MSTKGNLLAIAEAVENGDGFIGNFGGQPRLLPWETLLDSIPGGVGGGASDAADLDVAAIVGLFATNAQAAFEELVSKIGVLTGGKADLAGPHLTGIPLAPSPAANDNSTQIANTTWTLDRIFDAISGINPKNPAVVLVQPSQLAANCKNGDTQDTVVLHTNDRILAQELSGVNAVPNIANGIYIVQAAGAAVRAGDADTGAELKNAVCLILGGTYAGALFAMDGSTPTIGVNTIVFTQRSASGGGGYTADGATLSLIGSQFSVNAVPQAKVTSLVADLAAKAAAARTIAAAGLATGGGSLAADRTITVPKAAGATATGGTDDAAAMTSLAAEQHFAAAMNRSVGAVSADALATQLLAGGIFGGQGAPRAFHKVEYITTAVQAIPALGFKTDAAFSILRKDGGYSYPDTSSVGKTGIALWVQSERQDFLNDVEAGQIVGQRIISYIPKLPDGGGMLITVRRPYVTGGVHQTTPAQGTTAGIEMDITLTDQLSTLGNDLGGAHLWMGSVPAYDAAAGTLGEKQHMGFRYRIDTDPTFKHYAPFVADENTGNGHDGFQYLMVMHPNATAAPVFGITGSRLGPKGRVLAGVGTEALPAFAFMGDQNSGMYRVAEDTLGFAVNGALVFQVTPTALVSTSQQLRISGNKVIGDRITGWTLPSAGQSRVNFTGAATTAQLSAALSALIHDLFTHGMIGA